MERVTSFTFHIFNQVIKVGKEIVNVYWWNRQEQVDLISAIKPNQVLWYLF